MGFEPMPVPDYTQNLFAITDSSFYGSTVNIFLGWYTNTYNSIPSVQWEAWWRYVMLANTCKFYCTMLVGPNFEETFRAQNVKTNKRSSFQFQVYSDFGFANANSNRTKSDEFVLVYLLGNDANELITRINLYIKSCCVTDKG